MQRHSFDPRCPRWIEDVVRLLLERGANVNERGHGGRTAFHEAAENGSLTICSQLIERGLRSVQLLRVYICQYTLQCKQERFKLSEFYLNMEVPWIRRMVVVIPGFT